MFERLLIPLDFSASSALALNTARLHFPQARRRLLHVCDTRFLPSPAAPGKAGPERPANPGEASALRLLRQQLEAGETAEVVSGIPAEEILAGAQAWGADLTVMGTHGRRGVAHLLFGSVAEAVVQRATVPVRPVRVVQAPARSAAAPGRPARLRPQPGRG